MTANAETALMSKIQKACNKINGVRLFRNNCGGVSLGGGRIMRFGLGVGSSDLVGYKTVRITQDMVGKDIAVFLSLEVKTKTGKLTADQDVFLQTVAAHGGIAGVVRCLDDALRILGVIEK